MAEEFNTFSENFFDDSVVATNGFDTISNHANKTFDLIYTMMAIFENKIQADEAHARNCTKLVKNYQRNEHIKNPLIESLIEVIRVESDRRLQYCEDLKSTIVEPLREIHRSQVEVLRKNKSSIVGDIKVRKSQFDSAVKSCKNYTNKTRIHQQTFKTSYEDEFDEKIKFKMHKSLEAIRQAETETQVGVKTLQQSLLRFEKNFMDYCCKIEKNDHVLIDKACESIELARRLTSEHLHSLDDAVKSTLVIRADAVADVYCENFLHSSKQKNCFPSYASVYCEEVAGKKEYKIHLSCEPHNEADLESMGRVEAPKYTNPKPVMKAPSYERKPIHVQEPIVDNATNPARIGYTAQCIYKFTPEKEDELELNEGDLVKIVDVEDSNWYLGMLRGRQGVFPWNYVTFDY